MPKIQGGEKRVIGSQLFRARKSAWRISMASSTSLPFYIFTDITHPEMGKDLP